MPTMPNELLIALVAGFGGMFGWGLADFFAKKTIDELGDVMTLAWAGVFGTITFLIASMYAVLVKGLPVIVPTSPTVWGLLVFFGALQAAVYIFAYRGFGKGQVGLLAPVFASFSGVVAVTSILFFGEPTSGSQLFALAVIFCGIVLLNADMQALSSMRLKWNSIAGLSDVLIATVLAAVWTILWDRFLGGENWLFYALYMFIFMTITVFVWAYARQLSFAVTRGGLWKFIAAIGFCETIAYIAISLGYGATSYVSIVAILSGAFALPTIVLARLFLGERTTKMQTVGRIVALY